MTHKPSNALYFRIVISNYSAQAERLPIKDFLRLKRYQLYRLWEWGKLRSFASVYDAKEDSCHQANVQ